MVISKVILRLPCTGPVMAGAAGRAVGRDGARRRDPVTASVASRIGLGAGAFVGPLPLSSSGGRGSVRSSKRPGASGLTKKSARLPGDSNTTPADWGRCR
jgi:hypothetical protein